MVESDPNANPEVTGNPQTNPDQTTEGQKTKKTVIVDDEELSDEDDDFGEAN